MNELDCLLYILDILLVHRDIEEHEDGSKETLDKLNQCITMINQIIK